MGLLEKRLKGNGGRFSEKAEELRERRGVFLRILEKPQKFQAVGFQLCENTAILSLIAVVSIAATDDETAVVSISFFHHRKNKKGRKRCRYTGSLSSLLFQITLYGPEPDAFIRALSLWWAYNGPFSPTRYSIWLKLKT